MKNKIVLTLVSILIVLVGIAGFMFTRSSFSKEMLKLEIIGPDEISAGKEQEYIFKFKNNSNNTLEQLRLNIEFPQYSIVPESPSNMIVVESDKIESVSPGREGTIKIKARIFGKESDNFSIKASLTYSPKGLTARYSSKAEKQLRIKEVPISFEHDAPSRIETGKDLSIDLNYFSHIDYPLSDLAIEIQYPTGFDFVGSKPKAMDSNKWEIDSLSENSGGRIAIDGILYGQSLERKTFKAKIGIYLDGEFVELKNQEFDIAIKESMMEITQTINGEQKTIASPGETLNYEISFKNTGEGVYKDLSLAIKLKGEMFDLSTLKAQGAQTKEGESAIIWTGEQIPDLKILAPGEIGKVNFSVKVSSDSERKISEPALIDKIIIGETQQEFRLKLNSYIGLNFRAISHDEVFDSAGPIPLEVGKKSELTIVLDPVNYFNAMENVKIKGVLPENVSYTGKAAPEAYINNLTFDSQSRELVWNAGEFEAGTGIGSDKKVLTFQINITPTAEQKNQYAQIIKNLKITGTDKWTGQEVSYSYSDLTSKNISSLDQDDSKVK